MSVNERRCIRQDCLLSRECALFVKKREFKEKLFAGRFNGEDCVDFVDLHPNFQFKNDVSFEKDDG